MIYNGVVSISYVAQINYKNMNFIDTQTCVGVTIY
jgi:hypothetical protein